MNLKSLFYLHMRSWLWERSKMLDLIQIACWCARLDLETLLDFSYWLGVSVTDDLFSWVLSLLFQFLDVALSDCIFWKAVRWNDYLLDPFYCLLLLKRLSCADVALRSASFKQYSSWITFQILRFFRLFEMAFLSFGLLLLASLFHVEGANFLVLHAFVRVDCSRCLLLTTLELILACVVQVA